MKKIRNNVFETNSSSTHALTIGKALGKDYVPYGKNLKINWFNEENTLYFFVVVLLLTNALGLTLVGFVTATFCTTGLDCCCVLFKPNFIPLIFFSISNKISFKVLID